MAMRARVTPLLLPAVAASLGALALMATGMQTMAFTDYEVEAEPSFQALRHGDALGFLHHLPVYGGSLIMRAPFALLPGLWHGGDLALFRSVAVPCLLAAIALALVLFDRARTLGAGRRAAWLALALVAVNPLTLRALDIGHPEELLGGALCVAAGLAATGRRPVLAGVLLGAAVANKPWAAVAVVPVLLMLPHGRWRALAWAAGVAAIIVAPMLAFGTGVTSTVTVARASGWIFQPWQIWWFLGDHGHRVMGLYTEHVGYRTPPAWVRHLSHPLAILVPAGLALALARTRRTLSPAEGFALLALALHLRCLLDSWNTVYYGIPACLALVAWEVHARRPPYLALTVTALAWTTFQLVPKVATPDVQSAAYLMWSVPLAVVLGLSLWRPPAWSRATAAATEVVRRQLPTLAAARR
jgi:hypothetical protein